MKNKTDSPKPGKKHSQPRRRYTMPSFLLPQINYIYGRDNGYTEVLSEQSLRCFAAGIDPDTGRTFQ